MQRSDGPAIRDTVIWVALLLLYRPRAAIWFWGTWWCVPFFFVYGVLYGSLERLALARMRTRHRLQDALDERRRLPGRQVHADAQSGAVALEPCPPPHRHDHRRPRCRDRRDAPAGSVAGGPRLHRHPGLPLFAARTVPAGLHRPQRGGEELYSRDGVAQGGRRGALARGDLSRRPSRWRSTAGRSCR